MKKSFSLGYVAPAMRVDGLRVPGYLDSNGADDQDLLNDHVPESSQPRVADMSHVFEFFDGLKMDSILNSRDVKILVHSLTELSLESMLKNGVQRPHDLESEEISAWISQYQEALESYLLALLFPAGSKPLWLVMHSVLAFCDADHDNGDFYNAWIVSLKSRVQSEMNSYDSNGLAEAFCLSNREQTISSMAVEQEPGSSVSDLLIIYGDELSIASNERNEIKGLELRIVSIEEEIADAQATLGRIRELFREAKQPIIAEIRPLTKKVYPSAQDLRKLEILEDSLEEIEDRFEADIQAIEERTLERLQSSLAQIRLKIETKKTEIDEILAEFRVHQARIDSN